MYVGWQGLLIKKMYISPGTGNSYTILDVLMCAIMISSSHFIEFILLYINILSIICLCYMSFY